MKKSIINILLFTAGAAVGSLVTWKVVKTKYERIAQEEIDSVKETWGRLMRESDDDIYEDDMDEEELERIREEQEHAAVMTDYTTLAGKYSRTSDVEVENGKEGEEDYEVPIMNGPCVITPDEYGDGNYDHSLSCITYYSGDDVLADDWGVTLDIEETIGREALDHIGDYAEGVVHVRNERLQIDYEVVQDARTYTEVMRAAPPIPQYED